MSIFKKSCCHQSKNRQLDCQSVVCNIPCACITSNCSMHDLPLDCIIGNCCMHGLPLDCVTSNYSMHLPLDCIMKLERFCFHYL